MTMTIIRFKLFKITLSEDGLSYDPTFDENYAAFMEQQELPILEDLRKSGKPFRFIELIPDELPYYFWGADTSEVSSQYQKNLKEVCSKYAPETEVIKMTDLLKDKNLKTFYEKIFNKVLSSIDVDPKMFEMEVKRRSTYYTPEPLPLEQATELAKKAFALFAAEIAVLYQLKINGVFPDLCLLTKNDELDLYKYEFYKYPKNRPSIPRLFII